MRKYMGKYRGKVLYNGNHYFAGYWVYGFYMEDKLGNSYIVDTSADKTGYVSLFKVKIDPKTFGELYTITKKGVSFYEGDIISSRERPHNKHIIKYDEEESRFDCEIYPITRMHQTTGLKKSWLEEFDKIVIGTIYDKEKI